MKSFSTVCSAILVLFSACMLAACEKTLLEEDNEQGEVAGNLKVSVFQIGKTPFENLAREKNTAVTRSAMNEVVTRLNFAVYAMDGTRLKQVNQTSDKEGFGTCSFQLEEGTYQLVVVGHSSNGNPTMTDVSCIKFTNAQGFSDTFFYYGMVTIEKEKVDKMVALNRAVAMCRFVVTDDIPKNVQKMRFYYTGGSGAFDAHTGLGCVNSKQDVKFNVADGQKQFDLYTFLHDTEGTIHMTVTALDANGSELTKREFDVPMEQDYITWVSGAMFAGANSSSTTIGVTINSDWAGETYITF